MVNYGVSRGCPTCKKRRKKCDETRPRCDRCTRIGVVCPGYRDESEYIFRNAHSSYEILPKISTEIKMFVPRGKLLPSFAAESENLTIKSFIDRYAVLSVDRTISSGFLDALYLLNRDTSVSSDVAQAMEIIALAETANKTSDIDLLHRTRLVYGHLLGTLHHTFSILLKQRAMELLTIIVLLGIYEIVSDVEANSQHAAHARGLAAILDTKGYPFDFSTMANLLQRTEPPRFYVKAQNTALIHGSSIHEPSQAVTRLVYILNKLAPVLRKAKFLCSDKCTASDEQLESLKEEAGEIDKDCAEWAAERSDEWMPKTIGTISEQQARTAGFENCWPGNVDIYFDLSVSAVWNMYRKIRLMTLEIMHQCLQQLKSTDLQHLEKIEAQTLAEDMAASIPFHLTADVHMYLRRVQAGSRIMAPGRAVGGLLMIHPLNMAMECTAVSPELRNYMRNQLKLVGQIMGIGQATLLANHSISLPCHYIAEGQLIVWAGMLSTLP